MWLRAPVARDFKGQLVLAPYWYDGIVYRGKKVPYDVSGKPYNRTRECQRRLRQLNLITQ